jgi:hypothetical protein
MSKFKVGDRVKSKVEVLGLPVGSKGTVRSLDGNDCIGVFWDDFEGGHYCDLLSPEPKKSGWWVDAEQIEPVLYKLEGIDLAKAILDQGYFYDEDGNKQQVYKGKFCGLSIETRHRFAPIEECYISEPTKKENKLVIDGKEIPISEETAKEIAKAFGGKND